MARLKSQMEDIMGYPTGGDPSIIDPTTGKPYDDSSRMRQQAEITRQADAMEAFQPVELPEYLKTKVEEKQSSTAIEVSTDKLKTAYDDLVIPEKPLKLDSKGRPLESLRPKLRPTEDFGPSFNFKSPIDKTIELNYLLRDPNAKTKSKEIVSGLSEKTEEGERAIQGFYDSVAKGQGLSATENAWCAAFVHYILTELGADTLKGYKGQRARKYIDYGSPVDDVKNAQEGDIVIFDWNGDGKGDHVAFYAGTRITDQDNPNKISVVGGNQDDKVTLTTRNMSKVLGIRRITKDNINVSLSKDLAKNNPIFKLFVPAEVPAKDIKLKQGPRISNTQQADPFSVIPARYAQGGLTSMNDQTQMAFALGGEAETVDPVSGNDVPPGSLPEEVRDDIDAKLSEGEYVVPADVVRFFGVKYFEDLRTEAKMGLQQMDADGRIGGEPVPAQEQPQGQDDSMDVAKLKAALSSSGMYAGGLTDGNSLDNFIDDASRSPMVNGRMRAGGATVKMAVGGLVPTGTYGDVTKVDGIIKQLMSAANNDPVLMEKLSSKGIMINKTGADKKSAELQQANKPQEPLKADKGTLVSTDPFNLEDYDNLGSSIFDAAGIEDPLKAIEATFLDSKGVIEQIVLIAPDGMEIPVAWNSAMPIPPGFTKKATNEYGGTKPVASAAPVNNSLVRRKAGDGKTGDDSDTGGGGGEPTTTATPFNYREASIEALKSRYDNTKKYGRAIGIGSFFLGPIGTVIGIATKANYGIVKRRIEIELDTRIKEDKITDEDLGTEKNPSELAVFIKEVSTKKRKLTKAEQIIADKEAEPGSLNFEAFANKQGRGLFNVAPDQKGLVDKALDAFAQNAADKITEEVMKPLKGSGFEDSGFDTGFSDREGFLSRKDSTGETGLEKVTRLKQEQQVATSRRLERERKEREAREAAQRAAAAASVEAAKAQRRIEQANRSDNRDDNDFDLGSSLGTNTDTDYGATDYGTISSGGLYQEGGLVSMPAAKKKKKKQTTQRRKGLGTRP